MTATCASTIRSVVNPICPDPARVASLSIVALLTACTREMDTPPANVPAGPAHDLSISLSRDLAEPWVLVVTILSRSQNPICIRTDALRNPNSGQMHLELRDSRGRPLASRPSGFIPPPLEGLVRLEPGASTRGHYHLNLRFRRISSSRPFPAGLSAEASFLYDYCDNSWALQARSNWQTL